MADESEESREGLYAEAPLSFWLHSRQEKIKKLDDLRSTKLEEDVVKHVRGLVETSRENKQRLVEPTWLESLYMVFGAQNIEQDDRGRWAPRDMGEDERRIRNLMLPRAMYVVAQFLKVKPIWDTVAKEGPPENLARAERAEQMLRAVYHQQNLLPLRSYIAWSTTIFGSGIGKSYYDRHAGPLQPVDVPLRGGDGQPMADKNGKPMSKRQGWRRTGDVQESEVLPFFFHVPVSATSPDVDTCPWVAEETPLWVSDIYRRWRFMARPDIETQQPIMRLAADFTRFAEGLEVMVPSMECADMATVYEYHERGSDIPGFEEGVVLHICNDKIIGVGPQQVPYDCGYPYCHYVYIPRKNQFWGHSIMNELKGAQRDYNEDRRSLAVARDMGALPPIVEPVGSSIPEGAFIKGGVRRLKYTNQPPQVMQGFGQLNQALVTDVQENEKDMDRLAQQFGPTRGELIGKSPWSREALEFMREQQETTLQPTLFLNIAAFTKWGNLTLELLRKHVTAERLFYYRASAQDVIRFKASGDAIPEHTRVQVQETSALPMLKAALRQEILNNVAAGLYGSPEEVAGDPILRHRILQHMQTPVSKDLLPPELVDWDNAMQEAEDLLMTDTVPTMTHVENKQIHLRAHKYRANLDDFKFWPSEQQQLFMMHIAETEAMLEQEQAGQMEQQFIQQVQMATTEMVARGKVRDAEALLVSVRGLLEHFESQKQAAAARVQEASQAREVAMATAMGGGRQ
jgi:hypothetical protein